MNRFRLPNRRHALTEQVAAGGIKAFVTVGFGDDLRPREVFVAAGKVGSDARASLEDAATTISVALQFGVPAASLAKSIGRLDAGSLAVAGSASAGTPISMVGAVLDAVVRIEREHAELATPAAVETAAAMNEAAP